MTNCRDKLKEKAASLKYGVIVIPDAATSNLNNCLGGQRQVTKAYSMVNTKPL